MFFIPPSFELKISRTFCLLHNSQREQTIDISIMQLSFCLPSIEESSGHELCFISHPKYKRRVSCDLFGKLRMNTTWKGWEVFRFIKNEKNGNYIITSWTHDQKVLCSNEEGRVFTVNKEQLIKDDKLKLQEWKISLHPKSHGVRIESVEHANRFLAFSGEDLYTFNKEEDATVWHLQPAHQNQFFISSASRDVRLSCTTDDSLVTHKNRKSWEKWIVEPTNKTIGHFTIRSLEHGKYLGSSMNGKLVVSESLKHCWTIGSSPHGGIFIQSVDHGGCRLSCDREGNLCTKRWRVLSSRKLFGCIQSHILEEANGSSETWKLEPIMPSTINGKQIWTMVGVGTACAVAMPFAVMGVVGAMGFGAEGIVAGSIGASMMSSSAIASGGGIAAGSTVATLQSIGAAGLSASACASASAAGAAVGGLAASKGLNNGLGNIHLDEPEKYLPLCSWRIWGLLSAEVRD